MNGYQALANAIVIQAAKDYKTVIRFLKKHPRDKTKMKLKEEIERFFRSSWCEMLTNAEPEYLMRSIRKKVMK